MNMVTNINLILKEIEREEKIEDKKITEIKQKIKISKKKADEAISGLSLLL